MRLLTLLLYINLVSCDYFPVDNQIIHHSSDNKDLQEQGKYLVTILGCGDCHTPKIKTDIGMIPDIDRLFAGYYTSNTPDMNNETPGFLLTSEQNTAFKGPWGVAYASNITPDRTGIGYWSLENFTKALKEGKYKGEDRTRILLPPMPWQNYRNMKDEDIKAIYIYLKSVKPIRNIVPKVTPHYLKSD